ncbi:hypothetical protein C8R45DRAFT_1134663 [Mycena sanguinolenta]|nr:hypothetical protein C8R45DRAFT_1134663 [Mycena sanguinolenta]
MLGVVPAATATVDALNVSSPSTAPLSGIVVDVVRLAKTDDGRNATSLPALLLLLTSHPLLYPSFPALCNCARILTVVASFVMTSAPVPYDSDYLTSGGALGVRERAWAVDVNRFFQVRIPDSRHALRLPPGLSYRLQIGLITGWIHHLVYILITVVPIRAGWAHLFCLAAVMELPTFILGLSTLVPRWRSNVLFAAMFGATLIAFHLVLLYGLVMVRELRTPATILALVFPLHAMWFRGCIAGFVRQHKARVAARSSSADAVASALPLSLPVMRALPSCNFTTLTTLPGESVVVQKTPTEIGIDGSDKSGSPPRTSSVPSSSTGKPVSAIVQSRLDRLRVLSRTLLEGGRNGGGARRWLSGPAGWVSPGVTMWLERGRGGGRERMKMGGGGCAAPSTVSSLGSGSTVARGEGAVKRRRRRAVVPVHALGAWLTLARSLTLARFPAPRRSRTQLVLPFHSLSWFLHPYFIFHHTPVLPLQFFERRRGCAFVRIGVDVGVVPVLRVWLASADAVYLPPLPCLALPFYYPYSLLSAFRMGPPQRHPHPPARSTTEETAETAGGDDGAADEREFDCGAAEGASGFWCFLFRRGFGWERVGRETWGGEEEERTMRGDVVDGSAATGRAMCRRGGSCRGSALGVVPIEERGGLARSARYALLYGGPAGGKGDDVAGQRRVEKARRPSHTTCTAWSVASPGRGDGGHCGVRAQPICAVVMASADVVSSERGQRIAPARPSAPYWAWPVPGSADVEPHYRAAARLRRRRRWRLSPPSPVLPSFLFPPSFRSSADLLPQVPGREVREKVMGYVRGTLAPTPSTPQVEVPLLIPPIPQTEVVVGAS